jgi:hypothetical protein
VVHGLRTVGDGGGGASASAENGVLHGACELRQIPRAVGDVGVQARRPCDVRLVGKRKEPRRHNDAEVLFCSHPSLFTTYPNRMDTKTTEYIRI